MGRDKVDIYKKNGRKINHHVHASHKQVVREQEKVPPTQTTFKEGGKEGGYS